MNKIYENIISSSDIGIYISFNSFENQLNDNLFSNNNQKLVDESIVVDNYSSPGFELIVVFAAVIILLLRRNLQ